MSSSYPCGIQDILRTPSGMVTLSASLPCRRAATLVAENSRVLPPTMTGRSMDALDYDAWGSSKTLIFLLWLLVGGWSEPARCMVTGIRGRDGIGTIPTKYRPKVVKFLQHDEQGASTGETQ
jgi:hypothetical protein